VGAAVLLVCLFAGFAVVTLRILGVPLRGERPAEQDSGRTQPRSASIRLLLLVAAAGATTALAFTLLAAWAARVLAGMLS
jgi:hypothetical protein